MGTIDINSYNPKTGQFGGLFSPYAVSTPIAYSGTYTPKFTITPNNLVVGKQTPTPNIGSPTFNQNFQKQLQKTTKKYYNKLLWKNAGNAYLGGAMNAASTMLGSSLGSKLFGDSKMGDFAGQALGTAASKILGSTLKVPSGGSLADVAISGVTSSVFNQNTAGGRAASSIVNGIVPKVAENITKGVKLTSGFNFGNIAGIGLGAAQAAMKPKSEYSGEKGGITSTLDMLDSAGTAAVSAIPGVGQVIGLAKMGLDTGFKALNNAGYGTSGMTITDALLGSNIVGEALLPLSMINGKFGKTTTTLNPRTFQENQDLAKVESSYSNTVKQGIDAWNKQGKKYGLLSHGAYRKANRLVNMYGIANEALLDMVNENKIDEARIQANGLGNIQYNQDLQGGLNPRTLVAKEGAKLKPQELEIETVVPEMEIKSIAPEIEIESIVPKFQEGAKLEPQELEVVVIYPSEDDMKKIIEKRWPAIKNTSEYHIYRDPEYTREKTGVGSIEYIRQPEIKYENGFILKNPNETPTIVFNPDTNTIDDIQLDAIHHFRYADPKYQQVLKPFEDYLLQNKKGDVFWNSELGDKFRDAKQKDSSFSDFINKNINEDYIAQGIDGVIRDLLAPDKLRRKSEYDSDKFKYQPKEDADKQWLFDDTSRQLFQNIKDYLETGELKPQQFKNGGELNIIPEGALHKNLHHMANDENITKKGIPVVSEDENGKIVQNAEVERSEIVLRLSLTQKLEKMLKKYNSDISQKEKDDVATKAGQILVDELLNKTIDNTNELL